MTQEVQTAAFEDGKLRFLSSGGKGGEAVLALPLNRLLIALVRVPPETDPVEFSAPVLKGLSPFPDEELTIGCEKVCEDASGQVVIAAALPESAADDIGEALDAAKLNVVRIDALALGLLRGVWSALGESDGRRLVLMKSPDCLTAVVLDGDRPSALRAITDLSDLRLEVLRVLLGAETFGGVRKLEEIVVVESDESDAGDQSDAADQSDAGEADPFDALASFAPLRRLTVGADAALVGVAERTADPEAFNALPASWREMLEETRFKHKLARYLSVAGGLWLLAVAVLFGVPFGYGFLTDHQKALSKQHSRQYNAVKEMKAKVQLIQKYSDHARGALEIMKAVSDRLPEGVTLSNWSYRREDGVRVSGDAETAEATYAFKDEMDKLAGAGEDAVFHKIELSGPNASKGGYRFDVDCQYRKEDEE